MSFYRRVVTARGAKVHLSTNVKARWQSWTGETLCHHAVVSAPLDWVHYDNGGEEDHRPVDCAHCLGESRWQVFLLCKVIAGEPIELPEGISYMHSMFQPWRQLEHRIELERAAQRPLQEVE